MSFSLINGRKSAASKPAWLQFNCNLSILDAYFDINSDNDIQLEIRTDCLITAARTFFTEMKRQGVASVTLKPGQILVFSDITPEELQAIEDEKLSFGQFIVDKVPSKMRLEINGSASIQRGYYEFSEKPEPCLKFIPKTEVTITLKALELIINTHANTLCADL